MKHGKILYVPLKGRTAASGSRAMAPHEPRQVRKEAALREIRHVPRGRLEAVARRFKGSVGGGRCIFHAAASSFYLMEAICLTAIL